MRVLIASVGVLALAAGAAADTIKVPQDQPTIAAAEAVAVDGDTIKISKGVYVENVVVDVPNLTISGSGAIIDGTIVNVDGDCLTINAAGVTVTGITFRNGDDQIFSTGGTLTVTKCTFQDAEDDAIIVSAGNTLTVTSCKFTGTDGEAVSVVGSNDVTIKKCTVRSNGNQGFLVVGGNTHVEGNTLQFIDDNAGIDLAGDDAVVIKNKTYSTGSRGIEVDTGNDATIQNNTVTLAEAATGIYVDGSNPIVEKNKVSDVDGGYEVYGDNARVVNNKVTDFHGDDGYEVQANNMTVTGNQATTGPEESDGFYLYSTNVTGGGVVENCKVSDVMDAGFYLDSIYGVTVTSLQAKNCGSYDSYGIYVTGDANTLEKLSATDVVGTGIWVDSGTGDEFVKCTVKNVTGDGYRIYGSNHVLDNCSASGAAEGLDNRGTGTSVTGGKYRGYRFDITNTGGTFSGGLGTVNFVTGGSTQASEVD